MPTVQQIRDLADSLNLTWTKKMTKAQLTEIVGKDNVMTIDYAQDLADAKHMKGLIIESKVYKKICEDKTNTLYVGVFANGSNVVVVKGTTSGKGLGKGGAKWTYNSHAV